MTGRRRVNIDICCLLNHFLNLILFPPTAVLAKRMKVWERRLMKDFQVAPVEIAETTEAEAPAPVEENPLDRFRRISKQVASQSATIKWNEVIRCATIEANSQIGRCRNRDSFRNQQNLLKAMEQAKRLIERSPLPQSPSHSETYSIVDQTNETLVQLLKNISEEINEYSPQGTLCVTTPKNRSVTPLHSLNVQLQSLINSRQASPNLTKEKTKARAKSPKPTTLDLRRPSNSNERVFSPPPIKEDSPKTSTKACQKSRSETPRGSIKLESPKSPSKFGYSPLSKPIKPRASTPDASKSLDDTKSIDSLKNDSKPAPRMLKTPSVEITLDGETNVAIEAQEIPAPPLISFSPEEIKTQSPTSPVKVIKRKAPAPVPASDISIPRPTAPRAPSSQGIISPPPKKEEVKQPLQIPTLSTTPATPLPTTKQFVAETEVVTATEISEPVKPTIPEPVPYSSTEKLVTSEAAKPAASSPPMLRPVNKIEDVKTIKRQTKTGWL